MRRALDELLVGIVVFGWATAAAWAWHRAMPLSVSPSPGVHADVASTP